VFFFLSLLYFSSLKCETFLFVAIDGSSGGEVVVGEDMFVVVGVLGYIWDYGLWSV
jgi:hypothetical protein